MITAIVQFKYAEGTSRDVAMKNLKASVPKFVGAPGLIRKHYLYSEEGVGGGAYLWESREAAEAVYTPEWRRQLAERYGAEPTVSYFETPVVIDNTTGEVIDETGA